MKVKSPRQVPVQNVKKGVLKFWKVILQDPKTGERIGTVSGVPAFSKLDAIGKAKKELGVPSNIFMMATVIELKFGVGDTFPMLQSREVVCLPTVILRTSYRH